MQNDSLRIEASVVHTPHLSTTTTTTTTTTGLCAPTRFNWYCVYEKRVCVCVFFKRSPRRYDADIQ